MYIEIKQKNKITHLCRVAAYCRVSDDGDRLLKSLEAQRAHYEKIIPNMPCCVLAGIYTDEAVTGTKANRPGFTALLTDCNKGLIDIILCKSVSRFSRNTIDFLETCRHLKRIGVEVRFEKENISTATTSGELMLSLLSSFSQEESRSISENIKWGIRHGFEEGRFTHYHLYGYRYDGKQYVAIQEETNIIKRIFSDFLSGMTTWEIEHALAKENIYSPKGSRFSTATILRILRNPTYTGDAVLQREYIDGHITHKRRKNNGELAKYIVHGSHPTIISHEIFDRVQKELAIRKPKKQCSWHSGKIICGECGRAFRLIRKAGNSGFFFCKGREKHTCNAPRIREKVIHETVSNILGRKCDETTFTAVVDKITVDNKKFTVKMKNGGYKECLL